MLKELILEKCKAAKAANFVISEKQRQSCFVPMMPSLEMSPAHEEHAPAFSPF